MQDKEKEIRSKSNYGVEENNNRGAKVLTPDNLSNKYSANTLRNLKEKKDNPFWMPTHNAEIFEVRDILRQEKELRKAINRKKQKKKEDLNNLHKETLRDSYNENISNFYLTEQKMSANLGEFLDKYSKLKTNTEGSNFNNQNQLTNLPTQPTGSRLLQQIEEEKIIEKEKSAREDKNDLLQKKIDSIGGKKKESVRDYINKTRELILMKYSIDIKKERVVRLHETYNNEIESIKDSIFSMEEARRMFENEFYVKFEKYVKHLMKQKENEKTEENNLLETKMKLDQEKSKLSNKISKLEKEKKNYEDCLYFMIRVKEKILTIPENCKFEAGVLNNTNTGNTGNITGQNQNFSTSPAHTKKEPIENPIRNDQTAKNRANTLAKEEKEKFERIRGYFNGNTIFDSPKELLDEIKKMEADNINKLNEFNKINFQLNEVETELLKMNEDDEKAYENNTLDIEKKERQLKDLKDKNRKLTEEKNLLLIENRDSGSAKGRKNNRFNFSSTKSKYSEPQLFAKILEVFKSTSELNLGSNEIFEIVKKNSTEVEMNMLMMLKNIEKTMDLLNNKYLEFSKSSGTDVQLKVIENKLDHDRKQKKNADMKIQNQIDEIRKRKEMEERNNRVYVVPKRKIPERCAPRDKEDKDKKNDKNAHNELNFEDFIYY
jgi:hypothetical protein